MGSKVTHQGEINILHMCFVGADTFKVKISPLNKQEYVRIHVPPPLDRKDGSFLARYRLYGTVLGGLKVEVLHRGVAVAKSPYTIHGLCCFIHNVQNNEALSNQQPVKSCGYLEMYL